jgi:protocatechuate 3,4-dioxygenase beta subunit
MSKRLVFAFVVLILATIRISAQSHLAVVRGVVVDQSGKPVPEAMIRVISETTGERRTVLSGADDGRFAVPALQPGLYRVEAEKQGILGSQFARRVAGQPGTLAGYGANGRSSYQYG